MSYFNGNMVLKHLGGKLPASELLAMLKIGLATRSPGKNDPWHLTTDPVKLLSPLYPGSLRQKRVTAACVVIRLVSKGVLYGIPGQQGYFVSLTLDHKPNTVADSGGGKHE